MMLKPFALEPNMLTMAGVFYPTGHMFVMFPTLADAQGAAKQLTDDGYTGDSMSLVTPTTIQEQIARTISSADIPLPSAGSESDTVRRYVELANQGHHALLIHAPKAEESERIMRVLKHARISYAQKYRMLVIEDLD